MRQRIDAPLKARDEWKDNRGGFKAWRKTKERKLAISRPKTGNTACEWRTLNTV